MKVESQQGFFQIDWAANLAPQQMAQTFADFYSQLSGAQEGVALNVARLTQFDPAFARIIATTAKTMRDQKRAFVAINASTAFINGLRKHGLDTSLPCVSVIGALSALGLTGGLNPSPPSPKSFALDAAFISPFVEGALETLKMQCQIDSHAGKMFLKGRAPLGYDVAIAGVIALNSPSFNGSVALCFTEELFLQIMSNMMGEPVTEITAEIEDGAGELTNIIFGCAKKILNAQNYAIDKAIPTVVKGRAVDVRSAAPTIVLPFLTPHGAFHVEIAAEASGAAAS